MIRTATSVAFIVAVLLASCEAPQPGGFIVDEAAIDSAIYSTLLNQLRDGGAIVSTTPGASCVGPQPLRQYVVSNVRWTNIAQVQQGGVVLAYNYGDDELPPGDEGYRIGNIVPRDENLQFRCPDFDSISNATFLLRVGGFSRIKTIEPEEEFIGRLSNPNPVDPSPAPVDLFAEPL